MNSALKINPRILKSLLLAIMLLFLAFGLLANQQAQARLLPQATSSIKLTWASNVLSLTEQNAGGDGQLSVDLVGNALNLTLPAGSSFAAGSTAAGGSLTYPLANQASLNLATATVSRLGIDLGSSAASSLSFQGVNQPTKLYAVDIRSGGALTLTQLQVRDMISASVGSVVRGNAGINVVAPTIQLSGTYGVGALGNPLGTAGNVAGTGWLTAEVNAYTGSIYLNNTGDLRIGISNTNGISRSNAFPGIQVLATSGNHVVELGVTGVLSVPLISDTIKAPGAITVTVSNNIEAGCMIVGTNLPFVGSINGPVYMTSLNGDMLLGNYRANLRYYADITGKGVTLEAPNGSIIIDYVTYITSVGGPLNIKAKNAIRVLKTGGYSGATFYTMDVTPVNIEAPVFEMNSGGAIASSSAPMTITTDNATISATVRAPYYTLWLRPLTPGRAFDLGLGTTANTVGLNTTEIANLDASGGTVRYGGPDAGVITVTAAITRAGTARLWLDSPYTITQVSGSLATAGRISNNNLRLSSLNATLNQTNTAATATAVDGLIRLNRANGPTLSGALVVGDGLTGTGTITLAGSARVQLLQSTQFSTTPALTLYGDGLLQLNGQQQAVGALTSGALAGGLLSNTAQIDTSGGVLTTTHSTNTTFTGLITGTGTLVKSGAGTLTLSNDNTVRCLNILQGKVLVNGASTSQITLTAGILGGVGAAGSVNAIGGSFQPGLSPGVFTATDVTLGAASELRLEINGVTVGSGYDQLRAMGGVTLSNATLTIVSGLTTTMPAGQAFTLIDNQGTQPVSGAFTGLNEGITVTLGGQSLTLSYLGGDGNDVTLTSANLPVTQAVTGLGPISFAPLPVIIDVIDRGPGDCLSEITAQQFEEDHPLAATNNLKTGRYWSFTQSSCGAGDVFTVTLTVPLGTVAENPLDKLCRWTGTGWDCGAASAHTVGLTTITRANVNEFSTWTVSYQTGPAAVTLRDLTATTSASPDVRGMLSAVLVALGALVIGRRRLKIC